MLQKKMLCLILSALLCLSLFSCKKEETVTLTEAPTAESTEKTETIESGDASVAIENDIMGDIPSWLGYSESGLVKDIGAYETNILETAADLDPYRAYLSGLTAEEEAEMFQDEKGLVLLVEMTGETQHTLYSTANIVHYGDFIHIYITKCESEEEILPLHTYFLFYFPSTLYHGEDVTVSF